MAAKKKLRAGQKGGPSPNPDGRPHELTPQVHERLVKAIRGGAFFSAAARKAGIHPDTFLEYRKRGEADEKAMAESVFAVLSVAVARAREEWEDEEFEAVGNAVDKRGNPDWRARAWRLARMNPGRFGERQALELTGEVATRRSDLDPATLKAAAEETLRWVAAHEDDDPA